MMSVGFVLFVVGLAGMVATTPPTPFQETFWSRTWTHTATVGLILMLISLAVFLWKVMP
jgi:Na+(H+)/acetate symporter ActP